MHRKRHRQASPAVYLGAIFQREKIVFSDNYHIYDGDFQAFASFTPLHENPCVYRNQERYAFWVIASHDNCRGIRIESSLKQFLF